MRLLSIGEEPEKGNQLTLEAHALLARRDDSTSRATPRAASCCAAPPTSSSCDGFTGNMALKLLEGTIKTMLDALREEITAERRGKLGGLLIRPAARRSGNASTRTPTAARICSACNGLAVIAHGNSSRRAIANAIRLAARGVEHDVVGRLAERISAERTRGRV